MFSFLLLNKTKHYTARPRLSINAMIVGSTKLRGMSTSKLFPLSGEYFLILSFFCLSAAEKSCFLKIFRWQNMLIKWQNIGYFIQLIYLFMVNCVITRHFTSIYVLISGHYRRVQCILYKGRTYTIRYECLYICHAKTTWRREVVQTTEIYCFIYVCIPFYFLFLYTCYNLFMFIIRILSNYLWVAEICKNLPTEMLTT